MPERNTAAPSFRILLGWIQAPLLLALPAGVACEVVLDTPIAHLPGAPPSVLGLIHRQGAVLPVFAFSDPWHPDSAGAERLLLISRGRERLALMSDAQPDFGPAQISAETLKAALPKSLGVRSTELLSIANREELAIEWDPFAWSEAFGIL